MYTVYILQSHKTEKYYIGYTSNLEKRLKAHNSGKTKSLLKHIPLEIIKTEEYHLYEEARERERQIKSCQCAEACKNLAESDSTHGFGRTNYLLTPSAGCNIL